MTSELEKMSKLKLHQSLKIMEDLYVTKVPGGWLYTNNDITVMQFVPDNRSPLARREL